LNEFPPFLFATLRFIFAALPWLLVVRRPPLPWPWLALFGLVAGPGQFGLLYYAMRADISPGLASLLMQAQVFITIGLAVWFFRERVAPHSLLGLLLAVCGLVLIAMHTGASVTAKGTSITLLAACCWAGGNLLIKAASASAGRFDMLAFMIWSSLFAIPPLLAMTAFMERDQVAGALTGASVGGWLSVLWQSIGNTLIGFGLWNWLLSRHKAEAVTPYALLVPVFGMGASAFFLREEMPAWKVGAGALVVAGLAIHALAPTFIRRSRELA
jgi:O-acetylserine/cysteine efflux transporter